MLEECPNKDECGKDCLQCYICKADSGMVSDDCEGCCGNDGSVPYGRLQK